LNSTTRWLDGISICLVRESSVSNGQRLPLEIAALQDAGATVRLVTGNPDPADKPPGIEYFVCPLEVRRGLPGYNLPASEAAWRPWRVAQNLARNALRAVARLVPRTSTRAREGLLEKLAEDVDIFWVIDFPALESTLTVAKRNGRRVVYNTIDLVPENRFEGEGLRLKRLDTERRLISQVDGFITVSDSYADYYEERFAGIPGFRRPVVHGNAPSEIADRIRPTERPITFLFFGNLTFKRPIAELIEAASLAQTELTLTLMGENRLGDELSAMVDRYSAAGRVQILPPCSVKDAVRVVSGYDVGVAALHGVDENERTAETTKLYTYMAAGIAVLGSRLPGISRVVERHLNGWLVEGMTSTAWARAFDAVAALPNEEIDAAKTRSLRAAQ